ncbi:hypothetical protein [Ilumatobacter coccineus]|nr:hypothetical protein [Ilumatobacter coccineus]
MPEGWIDTGDLFGRLPVDAKLIRKYVRLDFLNDPETPEAIPLHQAVAVAAAAQAKARNVTFVKRVFETVVDNAAKQATHVLVVRPKVPLQLVPVDGFEPVPAVVIDLPELLEQVVSGDPIPG